MEEYEIDLKHMLYSVVKHWRVIMVWIVAGILALIAFSVYRQRKNNGNTSLATFSDFQALEASLTPEKIKETKLAVKTYEEYKSVYESAEAYINESIRMKLDSKNVATYTIKYMVDTHYTVEYPTINKKDYSWDICNMYATLFGSQELFDEIKEATGRDIDTTYIRELINCWIDDNCFLCISVYAENKDQCEAIANVMKQYVSENTSKVKKQYGAFDITLVTEDYYRKVDMDLLFDQQGKLGLYAGAKETFNSLTNPFTEIDANQAAYYDALINGEDKNVNGTSSNGDEASASIDYFKIKYIIVGAFVGVFLAVCWFAFIYIISNSLRIKDDVSDALGISVLGTVKADSDKKKIFGFIDKLIYKIFYGKGSQFTEEERIKMIGAGVRISADKGEMKNVFITGSCNDSETERIKDLVKSAVGKTSATIKSGATIVYDPESLEAMSASDGVVIVERTGYSLYEDILREKELCEKYNVPIIGAVVIE